MLQKKFDVIYGITIFNKHMAYMLLGWLSIPPTAVHFRSISHVLCGRCFSLCRSYVESSGGLSEGVAVTVEKRSSTPIRDNTTPFYNVFAGKE
jgi:hypothetical protein